MISDKNRSKWFGASDMKYIMGNWNTETFIKWWNVKLGITENHFTSDAMKAGTAYEGRILDFLGVKHRDRQLRIRKYRLRVNLDGETGLRQALLITIPGVDENGEPNQAAFVGSHVVEVKTHSAKPYKMPRSTWWQVQAQMYATSRKRSWFTSVVWKIPVIGKAVTWLFSKLGLEDLLKPFDGLVVSYLMMSDDYDNYYNEIDNERLQIHYVPYDELFIYGEMIPRLIYLSHCLKKRITPNMKGF